MTATTRNEVAIACTLGADDMRVRFTRIRALSARALLSHQLDDRTLLQHFAPQASAEVRALVEAERECCAFAEFELAKAPDGLHLTVVAPAEAGKFAALLFPHFAPQTQAATPVAPSAPTCGCAPRGCSAQRR
ncbi:hypothetical protein [Cupriavidus alkaliphilus]|uniref:hypothetical protein n=1 Tax=Cupriavidus alkaliphilus TaxID=942866 RepID=UPI00339D9820